MTFQLLYSFATKVGIFYVAQSSDGRFHPVFNDQSLGSYSEAWQAAEDLAGGHTFLTFPSYDTSLLGIPEDLAEWQPVSR